MAVSTVYSCDPAQYLADTSAHLAAARRKAAEYLTDEEAADLLGLEPKTIRVWRKTRGLPFIRLSSRAVRIRRADLEAWLETMREKRVVLSK